ncbi:MAG: proton-conducting transporter membrane subunit [Cyanobacteriota bacterium]|nr:proton-conducting transporter membrane subunit [Cyanobacteriota bacterium]
MISPIDPLASSLPLLLKAWLLAPFLGAFLAALLPSLARGLLLVSSLATALVGISQLLGSPAVELELLGSHGVALSIDQLSGWFLLLNALVLSAVLLDGWATPQTVPQRMLLLVLQGGLNVAFVATDLVSLYVTLELVGITAFLLIVLPQRQATLWVGLRYLLVGNTAMSLYLIGAALVYVQQQSFRLEALVDLSFGAPQVFLLIGLFTKAGLFAAGLWLPRTHAEAPAQVSALLSGVVVAAGVAPLLRLAELDPLLLSSIRWVGGAGAVLGVIYALAAGDSKRLLAWSTLSQMGLIVLSPLSGGALALAHGLAKGGLFLSVRHLPSRQLAQWRTHSMPLATQACLWIGSLSIAGLPPLAGFAAKKQLAAELPSPWSSFALLVSIGTVAVYAQFWPLLLQPSDIRQAAPAVPFSEQLAGSLLMLPLVAGGLLAAGEGVSWSGAASTALVLAAGLLLRRLLDGIRRNAPQLCRSLALPDIEGLQQLLGGIVVLGAGLLATVNWNLD